MLDAGTEFSDTKRWLNKKKIGVRVGEPGRHRQQAVVEGMNKTIGGGLLAFLNNNETVSGKLETNWIQFLPQILEAINDNLKPNKTEEPLGTKALENDDFDVKCGVTKKKRLR